MSLPNPEKLADAIQRGALSPGDEAQLHSYLLSHPEERIRWEDDLNLNALLQQMPDAPISSNFTAQVLDLVRKSQSPIRVPMLNRVWGLLTSHWIPNVAVASAVFSIVILGYQRHLQSQRQELARNVAEISKQALAAGATVDLLQNFDAIQRLSQAPRDVDSELIAALK